mmetsp:Transcript_72868/g.121611  ORF Transcript_72868/g.121611 Transcript_72868/m.121611 type:complete len:932 (+) Transcript_72868:57-2852(+)
MRCSWTTLLLSVWTVNYRVEAICPGDAGATGDVHIHHASGGRTDVKGYDNAIINMFQSANLSVNARFTFANFTLPSKDLRSTYVKEVHGSFMTAAHVIVRASFEEYALLEYDVARPNTLHLTMSKLGLHKSGGVTSKGDMYMGEVRHMRDELYKVGDLSVDVQKTQVHIATKDWDIFCISGTYRTATTGARKHRLDLSIKALTNPLEAAVAPHGVIGQGFDGLHIDGKLDSYIPNNKGVFVAYAQGQGAIEGVLSDYLVQPQTDHFSTDFKFARFGKTRAPSRAIDKLNPPSNLLQRPHSLKGAMASAEEQVTSVEEQVAVGRRLSAECYPPSMPPSTPPATPPCSPPATPPSTPWWKLDDAPFGLIDPRAFTFDGPRCTLDTDQCARESIDWDDIVVGNSDAPTYGQVTPEGLAPNTAVYVVVPLEVDVRNFRGQFDGEYSGAFVPGGFWFAPFVPEESCVIWGPYDSLPLKTVHSEWDPSNPMTFTPTITQPHPWSSDRGGVGCVAFPTVEQNESEVVCKCFSQSSLSLTGDADGCKNASQPRSPRVFVAVGSSLDILKEEHSLDLAGSLAPAYATHSICDRLLNHSLTLALEMGAGRSNNTIGVVWLGNESAYRPSFSDLEFSEIDHPMGTTFNSTVMCHHDGYTGDSCNEIVCFPGAATVTKEDGSITRMDQLALGDSVACVTSDGSPGFCRLYGWLDISMHTIGDFIEIYAEGLETPLQISSMHIMFASDEEPGSVNATLPQGRYTNAAFVSAGDKVAIETGGNFVTKKVVRVQKSRLKGAFSPMLESGDFGSRPIVNKFVVTSEVGYACTQHLQACYLLTSHWRLNLDASGLVGTPVKDVPAKQKWGGSWNPEVKQRFKYAQNMRRQGKGRTEASLEELAQAILGLIVKKKAASEEVVWSDIFPLFSEAFVQLPPGRGGKPGRRA